LTEESRLYIKVGKEFVAHETVTHSHGEYVRGDIHTNTVESYFSIFKRGMRGTYQHCAEKHLHRYLAEFDFRHNNRSALGVSDYMRAELLAKGIVGKRLTYRRPHLQDIHFEAARFVRWRKKQPKRKPKFVRYWQSRKPANDRA
jgi:hypothetical protein